jgi:2-amino-4-hydroxy-6-hydroxymethyldihydropteridine diphosphokinase
MRRVAIAVGSNLGDRDAHIDFAISHLRPFVEGLVCSAVRETEAEADEPQPPFLNAVVVGGWRGSARALLDLLLGTERKAGRARPYPGAARTLDLDLILFGADVIHEPDLEVPHPRFRGRAFVLEPLAEVAPDLIDPVSGLSPPELLARLRSASGR